MDGPDRAVDDGGSAERIPRGEDCMLRGVPLRWSGGDLWVSSWLRALPREDALGSVDSNAVGYRAYC
jgi:hypothetical protein